jgi:hypothetical protein
VRLRKPESGTAEGVASSVFQTGSFEFMSLKGTETRRDDGLDRRVGKMEDAN